MPANAAPASAASARLTPRTFAFLEGLAAHNDKTWFEAHKRDYEADVREPALALIRALGPGMAAITKNFRVDDSKVGGSLMRIHRDVRFSTDKSPYKTNVGIQLRHATGKDVHAPGFYIHFDAKECFFGAGLWHPEPPVLAAIRTKIAQQPAQWRSLVGSAAFGKGRFVREGEQLARIPRGFPADHEHAEDLRRKDHIAVIRFSRSVATSADLPDRILAWVMESAPFMRFLCAAVDVPF